jgi:hypothetical protein
MTQDLQDRVGARNHHIEARNHHIEVHIMKGLITEIPMEARGFN